MPFHSSNAGDFSGLNGDSNIPPRVRFALYVIGALATPAIGYLYTRGIFGDAEVALAGAYLALVNVLAAAKTDISA